MICYYYSTARLIRLCTARGTLLDIYWLISSEYINSFSKSRAFTTWMHFTPLSLTELSCIIRVFCFLLRFVQRRLSFCFLLLEDFFIISASSFSLCKSRQISNVVSVSSLLLLVAALEYWLAAFSLAKMIWFI